MTVNVEFLAVQEGLHEVGREHTVLAPDKFNLAISDQFPLFWSMVLKRVTRKTVAFCAELCSED